MKKVELHVHIDGSVRPLSAWEMAKERGLITYEDQEIFLKQMQVSKNCHNLNEYLACFDPVLSILQDEKALYRVTYELIEDLVKEDVIYAELRFAPSQHTKNNASQEAILKSVIRAIEDASQVFPSIKVNLILCMMVLNQLSFNQDDNEETLRLAIAYHHKGVCALDLAGAEGSIPLKAFMPYFMEAKLNGLPYTIHAGENPYPQHVELALIMNAKRIGHGIASILDPNVISFLKEKQVPLELCLTSNVQCALVDSYQTHPIKKLLEEGVLITINTDNRTISNTSLSQEYEILKKEFSISEEQLLSFNQIAIKHAFLTADEKVTLLKQLETN